MVTLENHFLAARVTVKTITALKRPFWAKVILPHIPFERPFLLVVHGGSEIMEI